MKYHNIKTKIDKVLGSCTSKGQRRVGRKWLSMLINIYTVPSYDRTTLEWYLDHWDNDRLMMPDPPPAKIYFWPRD